MTTTVPPALMSSSSWKTPRVARSSRFPVCSRRARSPERSHGPARWPPAAVLHPKLARIRRAFAETRPGSEPASPGRQWCRARPGHLERKGELFSAARRSSRRRKSWNTTPSLRRASLRRRGGGCDVVTRDPHSPPLGRCSANSIFMMVDFPAPNGRSGRQTLP